MFTLKITREIITSFNIWCDMCKILLSEQWTVMEAVEGTVNCEASEDWNFFQNFSSVFRVCVYNLNFPSEWLCAPAFIDSPNENKHLRKVASTFSSLFRFFDFGGKWGKFVERVKMFMSIAVQIIFRTCSTLIQLSNIADERAIYITDSFWPV